MVELHFANILCGVIRGALEMIHMRVECKFVSDMLVGDAVNAIRCVVAAWLVAWPPSLPCMMLVCCFMRGCVGVDAQC